VVKVLSLSNLNLILFSLVFALCLASFYGGDMTEINQSKVKIDVVKFDGTNNFGIWKCEVMDALTTLNLEDALRLEEKPDETSEKNGTK